MTPVRTSAIKIGDSPTEVLDLRPGAQLQALAALRVPITRRDQAKTMLPSPSPSPSPLHTIHQVTGALERLMAADAAAGLPFVAAMQLSKWRGRLPARGFFGCAARPGRVTGDANGSEARAFSADEFNASVGLWARSCPATATK